VEDAQERAARARFEEGLARARAGQMEEARLAFLQALAVMHRPSMLWNLALTEEKTHRELDALGHFKEYMRLAPADDPDRERCQKHIDALNLVVGHVLVTAPVGAAITLDGNDKRPVAFAPLAEALDVAAGHHVVRAVVGSTDESHPVEAAAGQVVAVSFGDVIVPPAPPAGARMNVASAAPGSSDTAPKPLPEQAAAPGTFWTTRVVVTGAFAAGALAALAAGVGFGIASNANAATVNGFKNTNPPNACANNNPSDMCRQWQDALDGANRNAALAEGFYIASGVLGATAIVTYLLIPSEPKKTSIWITPAASPTGVGLGALGRF
jgi:hypothetical protein